jgi:hypothetical protein
MLIVPTRELVMQMRDVLLELLPPNSGITVGLAIGGESEEDQRAQLLYRPPTIILGTPARLYSLFAKEGVAEQAERQQFSWPARLKHTFSETLEHTLAAPLQHIETIVVDEADSVLDPLPAHARSYAQHTMSQFSRMIPIFPLLSTQARREVEAPVAAQAQRTAADFPQGLAACSTARCRVRFHHAADDAAAREDWLEVPAYLCKTCKLSTHTAIAL